MLHFFKQEEDEEEERKEKKKKSSRGGVLVNELTFLCLRLNRISYVYKANHQL
jgi:hypothetical protein